MELCWAFDPKCRPSFKEILRLLLSYVSDEDIERLRFKERSFYYEDQRKQQMGSEESNNQKQSKRQFKKDYLNDQPPDDGSDRPLTEAEEKSDLMESAFIQQNNNSNTSSEDHRLSDFTSVLGDRTNDPFVSHEASSEFLEDGSVASLSGTDSNDKDDLSKLGLVKPEQVIVQIPPLNNGQPESRKSRQESISCQSSSSASESNGENFENLMDPGSNVPVNGNLPNGNILLNS